MLFSGEPKLASLALRFFAGFTAVTDSTVVATCNKHAANRSKVIHLHGH